MVVDLSCARALGTALESEGRSKPTRQDSATGRARRFPRRLFAYLLLLLGDRGTKVGKEGRFYAGEIRRFAGAPYSKVNI